MTTKKDQIVAHIRELIASGELRRGERVHQDELATRFEVSTTPVREALRELQAEGLLTGEPHRGVRVASADPDELRGVYIMRRLVEPYALQRASLNVTRADLAKAHTYIEEMRRGVDDGDDDAVRIANRDFHFFLYERADVPGLVRVIQQLWTAFPWDVLQVLEKRASASVDEHVDILDAVAEGDLVKVKASLDEHLRASYLAIAERLGVETAGDPFEVELALNVDAVTDGHAVLTDPERT